MVVSASRLAALCRAHAIGLALLALAPPCLAQPALSDPGEGSMALVAREPVDLHYVDGLVFDAFDNLFAALEIDGPGGSLVYVDKATGTVTPLVSGIPTANEVAWHPSGDLFVTSERRPGSGTDRVHRVTVTYDLDQVPIAASAVPLVTTPILLDNSEGVVVLDQTSPYGLVGELLISEDIFDGRILHLDIDGTARVFVDSDAQLAEPEGMAFGDFGGALPPTLYVAETSNHRVIRVDADGSVTVLGDPASIGLKYPNTLEFGWDGFLYVAEDVSQGRIIRIGVDGVHSVVATGFSYPEGLSFDPASGDLYISEQFQDSIHVIDWSAEYEEAHPSVLLFDDGAATVPDAQSWLFYANDALVTGGSTSRLLVPEGVELTTNEVVSGGFSNYIPNPFDLDASALKNPAFPVLDRIAGFEVRFQLRVETESHLSEDRAGFSLTVVSEDLLGIELGFWLDEIWAQSGPSFEHAEGVAFDTGTEEVTYRLAIEGDVYRLFADGAEILSGPLRDYSLFGAPYSLPGFLYLGDNTGSASAQSLIGKVAVWTRTMAVVEPPYGEIIVDDLDANTQSTGNWRVSSGRNPYGGRSLYNRRGETFTWTPDVPVAGLYEVWLRWTFHANRSSNVPYTVYYDGGDHTETFDQHNAALGGEWQYHGTYPFAAGSGGSIVVSSENGQASADAVKLVPTAPPTGANLSLALTDALDPVTEGEDVTYTVKVSNAGPETALSVQLAYTLPANASFVSATPDRGSCNPPSGVDLTCDLGNLAAGASTDVTLVVITSAPGLLTNTASVTSSATDPDMANNADTENTTVYSSKPPREIIVDDLDANTQSTGNWRVSSGRNPYGERSLYNHRGATFTWTPDLPVAGLYEVWLHWTFHANRSSNVPYTVYYDGGDHTETFDQHNAALAGEWQYHGTYPFAAGSDGSIVVSSENGQASADAVKLVAVP